jgi:hypothetical protein
MKDCFMSGRKAYTAHRGAQYSGVEMKDVPDMGQADKPSSEPSVTNAQSSGSEANGITDPSRPTGQVNLTASTATPIITGTGHSGLVQAAVADRGGWQILNLRWWAVAAFVAFILSRLSSLGSA